jgi:hypothetical protein
MILKLGSNIFDSIFSDSIRKKIEKITIWTASIGFFIHLILVIINSNSFLSFGIESSLLSNPISAIYTPFSIILYYEIFLLIFYLPRSFTTSILKQFEIISLILIRRVFYDIPKLDLNSSNWFESSNNLQLTYDIITILILFFLIYLFSYVKSKIKTTKAIKKVNSFIDSKKIISIVLVPVMIILFIYSFYQLYLSEINSNYSTSFYFVNEVFYTTFFSILIIADVFILLLSFIYTERYSQIMRNTGFIICTILIRLSFSSSGLTNLLLIISSVTFGLLILKIYSLMNEIE